MREIKYRAWCEVDHSEGTSDNKMVYFNQIECDNGLWFEAPDKVYHINEYHYKMHSMGLQDKKGKDIYKGDVVRPSGEEGVLAQIIFIAPSFKITTKLKNGNYINWNYIKDEIEVIGNIHENPELINLQK